MSRIDFHANATSETLHSLEWEEKRQKYITYFAVKEETNEIKEVYFNGTFDIPTSDEYVLAVTIYPGSADRVGAVFFSPDEDKDIPPKSFRPKHISSYSYPINKQNSAMKMLIEFNLGREKKFIRKFVRISIKKKE